MAQFNRYVLKPTPLIPNSPQPLLHYKGLLLGEQQMRPENLHQRFDRNGWKTQWIVRYGPTQESHYHANLHECMVVLSGSATIRFGVADTSEDMQANTHGDACESGGLKLEAKVGDVFVIPAGVAHKTYDPMPSPGYSLLSPGKGRGIEADDVQEALSKIELSGFVMMGAYPKNCGNWDFTVANANAQDHEFSWTVARPDLDPVVGQDAEGLLGHWRATAPPVRGEMRFIQN